MNRTDQLENTTLGFTATLTPLRAGKAEKNLNEQVIYRKDGKSQFFSKKAFVVYYLEKGYLPEIRTEIKYKKVTTGYFYNQAIREDVPYESTSFHLASQVLDEDGSRSSWEISKTVYDFAQYLLEATTIANMDSFITQKINEQQVAELKVKEEERAQAEFDTWLAEKALAYDNERYLKIQKSIFIKYFGSTASPSARLLVLIENFDNPRCKDALIKCLHNDNKASIETFEYITGIKLKKSYKARSVQLQNMTNNNLINSRKGSK